MGELELEANAAVRLWLAVAFCQFCQQPGDLPKRAAIQEAVEPEFEALLLQPQNAGQIPDDWGATVDEVLEVLKIKAEGFPGAESYGFGGDAVGGAG